MSDLTYPPVFGVGLAGPALAPSERRALEAHPPRAVILFRRNIESVEQVLALTGDIRKLPGRPRICVDQEGGPVDRFRDLLGPSISFREAAASGVARRAGELAGEACAALGFDVDLAPVADRLLPGASERVLRDRCASGDPALVIRASLDFLAGLHARGVGGGGKHLSGLGGANLDTHKELPLIPPHPEGQERDLAPGLLRGSLGFTGAAFSDDLEMGALSAFGPLLERCVVAARAGCDLLFVCSRIEEYPDCVEKVGREVPPVRLAEASARLDAYVMHLDEIRRAASIPERPLAGLMADIAALHALSEV